MKIRVLLVGAVVAASVVVGTGPASASCRPERPETCEVELPIQPDCYLFVELPGHSLVINYCDPSSLIPQ